jgi:predicted GNAT family acetyltransferase
MLVRAGHDCNRFIHSSAVVVINGGGGIVAMANQKLLAAQSGNLNSVWWPCEWRRKLATFMHKLCAAAVQIAIGHLLQIAATCMMALTLIPQSTGCPAAGTIALSSMYVLTCR